MTATVRYSALKNDGPALLLGELSKVLSADGKDYALKVIRREIGPNEKGTGVNQTQDSRVVPDAKGLPVVTFTGQKIIDVLSLSNFRRRLSNTQHPYYRRVDGLDDSKDATKSSLYEWSISKDGKTLFFYDDSADGARIEVGDILQFILVVGNY